MSKKIKSFIKKIFPIMQKPKISELSKTLFERIFYFIDEAEKLIDSTIIIKERVLPLVPIDGDYFDAIDVELQPLCKTLDICHRYEISINDSFTRKYRIFISGKKKHSKDFLKYARKMAIWLYTANKFTQHTCAEHTDIYIYLTDHKKLLPSSITNVSKTKPRETGPKQIRPSETVKIETENANTGFTYACNPHLKKNEIYIYRFEEWFKVFIHESFHALGLDFASFSQTQIDAKIHSIFPVNNDPRFYETYTEMWAELINAMFLCSHLSTFDLKMRKLEEMLTYEIYFASFQCCKILDHFDMEYTDLFEKSEKAQEIRNTKYKEETPVMAYYIFKAIFMNNINTFVEWCCKKNVGSIQFRRTNMDSLLDLLLSLYNDKPIISQFKKITAWIRKNKKSDFVFQTLRMTINE